MARPKGIPAHNKLPRETRMCNCGCRGTFVCKVNSEQRFINNHYTKTKEFKNLLHQKYTGRKLPEEVKSKIGLSQKGKVLSKQSIKQRTTTRMSRGYYHSPKAIQRMTITRNNRAHLMLQSRISTNLWKNPDYRKKCATGWKSPNKAEDYLNNLLHSLFPHEYKFVGDGKVWIESFNPDFININGQKKIIELFGVRWHTGERKEKRDAEKFAVYKAYGYETLVIWGNELRNINQLKEKLVSFNQGGK
jgi:very-short-patch-repair endonuclease